ncbi:MAG: MBL fold metallo-hydrolase [Chloroflexota bacterium]
MMNIEEVAEKTYVLETPVPGLETNFSVYLINSGPGVLLEPGPAAAVPAILKGMAQIGMKTIDYVIPTHIHIDHAGAVGKLAQLFPKASVVIHPRGAKHAIDPSRLIQGTKMAFGDDFQTRYGEILPVPESQVKIPADGEVIEIGDRGLKVIYAPGHAPHHMAVFDEKTRGLFAGEALGTPVPGSESFILPSAAPPIFDIEEYLETIGKLRKLAPACLFYSHDGVGKEPDALISLVVKNTKAFGDLILKALKEKQSQEAIEGIVQKEILARSGHKGEALMVTMAVAGYTAYYQKKELV